MRKQGSIPQHESVSDVQSLAQLRALRRDDSSIAEVILTCSHAAVYILENGTSVHWRKLGIEGFFYVVRRDSGPKYRILLRNQTDSGDGDFTESLDDEIRFEVKEGTFFYQIGGHGEVKGLWFHDPEFMSKFVHVLQGIYAEMRLPCDGSYGRSLPESRRDSSTPNGGAAILQLLKRDTPCSDDRSYNPVSPADVRSLLRREFTPPSVNVHTGGQRSSAESMPALGYPHHEWRHNSSSAAPVADSRPLVTSGKLSREIVKRVLTEMVLSDDFINEFFEKLQSRLLH